MTQAATVDHAPAPRAARREDGVAGLRTVFRIFDELRITADEGRVLLGGLPRATYYRWRKHPERANMTRDLMERLSYLLGIYKAIVILVPDERQQARFLRRANNHPVCAGRTPLDVMLGGHVADLYKVRHWLDGERGW